MVSLLRQSQIQLQARHMIFYHENSFFLVVIIDSKPFCLMIISLFLMVTGTSMTQSDLPTVAELSTSKPTPDALPTAEHDTNSAEPPSAATSIAEQVSTAGDSSTAAPSPPEDSSTGQAHKAALTSAVSATGIGTHHTAPTSTADSKLEQSITLDSSSMAPTSIASPAAEQSTFTPSTWAPTQPVKPDFGKFHHLKEHLLMRPHIYSFAHVPLQKTKPWQ